MRAMRSYGCALVVIIALVVATWSAHAVAPAPAYRIICHPSQVLTTADRRFVQDVFLKKVSVWATGQSIRPVDLAPSSPVRRAFTEEILRRPVQAVRNYWQQRIFAGRELPPPEVSTEDEAVTFVLHQPGAIGYVSPETPLRGAKILTVP